ncbi:MAG: hypothetical protein JWN36_3070 [Microbacteriaceae bacterium]|nr:hypothetical protein [Microbacteriaceae bacterium]
MTRQQKIAGGEFSIILPGTWASIPMDDDEAMERRIKALVVEQVGRNDRFAKTRREVREQLTDVARKAKQNGAISFVMSLEIMPGVPFPASIMIAEAAWPDEMDGTGVEGAEARLRFLRPDAEILELHVGPVARIAEVTEMAIGDTTTPQVQAQYWVTAADAERVFRIFADVPMAEQPDLYLELLDSIVDSMLWIQDDDA